MTAPTRRFLTDPLPGSGGLLRSEPEDFHVDEHLPYAPEGQGTHLFVRFEKIGLTTPQAVEKLLEPLGLTTGRGLPPDVGYAGLKDRHARTLQWMSIPWDKPTLPDFQASASEDLHVIETVRHSKKLRRGHTASNRFRIVLRDVPAGGFERAQAIVARLAETGVPHFFGPQRFGKNDDNDQAALDMLRGRTRPPRDRRRRDLYWSALQSRIFNRLLTLRIEQGLLSTALKGDWMQKHQTGGMFTVEDTDQEQPRVDALEISPTGPLPGKKYRVAQADAGQMEAAVIASFELSAQEIGRLGPGTRRSLRYPLDPDIRLESIAPDAFRVEVTLPSGAYATVLLDEIVKPATGPFTREPFAP